MKRDAASEAHTDSFDENGTAIEGTSKMMDESMSSGAENETQDEDDDSEDEEALVVSVLSEVKDYSHLTRYCVSGN